MQIIAEKISGSFMERLLDQLHDPLLTKDEFFEIIRQAIVAKHLGSKFLSITREIGCKKWDPEFVADCEVKAELDFGIKWPEKKPQLDPSDKSTGILTLPGISQQIELWVRKQSHLFPTWDRPHLEAALRHLEPANEAIKSLQVLLEAKSI